MYKKKNLLQKNNSKRKVLVSLLFKLKRKIKNDKSNVFYKSFLI